MFALLESKITHTDTRNIIADGKSKENIFVLKEKYSLEFRYHVTCAIT